jgi:hypothetical protein
MYKPAIPASKDAVARRVCIKVMKIFQAYSNTQDERDLIIQAAFFSLALWTRIGIEFSSQHHTRPKKSRICFIALAQSSCGFLILIFGNGNLAYSSSLT